MKKTISLLLVLVLLASCLSLTAFADDFSLAVSTSAVKPGEQTTVSITMSNPGNTEIFAGDFVVNYDTDNLTLVDATPGSAICDVSTVDGGGFVFYNENEIAFFQDTYESFAPSGEIVVLTFSAKDDAEEKDYPISLGVAAGSGMEYFMDEAGTSFTTATTAGKITVSSLGDEPGPNAGGGNISEIDYAWSYGGNIAVTIQDSTVTFTITPYTADGITYVIDSVYVDGVEQTITDNTQAMVVSTATRSVYASFAYVLNF